VRKKWGTANGKQEGNHLFFPEKQTEWAPSKIKVPPELVAQIFPVRKMYTHGVVGEDDEGGRAGGNLGNIGEFNPLFPKERKMVRLCRFLEPAVELRGRYPLVALRNYLFHYFENVGDPFSCYGRGK
jgi:hypothetical protein